MVYVVASKRTWITFGIFLFPMSYLDNLQLTKRFESWYFFFTLVELNCLVFGVSAGWVICCFCFVESVTGLGTWVIVV